jgi:hypothetical protein
MLLLQLPIEGFFALISTAFFKSEGYNPYLTPTVDCQQLFSIVDAIDVLEAFKRIPEEFRGFTFFGVDDRWLYLKSGNPNLCENCLGYDGEVFYGDSLRVEFPYLRIIDENTINPNVHPHCECLLIRVTA